jgi:hypothetical protein
MPLNPGEAMAALLGQAKRHGYEVDSVKLPDGTEVRLRPAALPSAPPVEPRRPEESDDAYAARKKDADARAEYERHVRRYTRELGSRKKAMAFVDRCLAAPGGVVP